LKEVLLLLLLRLEGPVGRYTLKDMLGMTDHEGTVKLMLSELKHGGHVATSRRGSALTPAGETLLDRRLSEYRVVNVTEARVPLFAAGPVLVGVQIRGKATAIQSGIEQRDAAIRAGAIGATVMTLHDGILRVPTVYRDLASEHPDVAAQIRASYPLADDDVLILVSARTPWTAYASALATAMTLASSTPSLAQPPL
jgi:hypothetical protein